MSGCLCVVGDTYLLTSIMQPGGPFLAWILPHPLGACLCSLPTLCRAPVPDLRVCSQTFPYLGYLYSLATPPLITHSLCPKGKGPGRLRSSMLHAAPLQPHVLLCLCVCARAPAACWNPITPWLLDRLLFSSWKSRHAAAAVYGTLLGHTRTYWDFACCRVVVVVLELSAIGIRHRIKGPTPRATAAARAWSTASAC
jgi:hypothetical protein